MLTMPLEAGPGQAKVRASHFGVRAMKKYLLFTTLALAALPLRAAPLPEAIAKDMPSLMALYTHLHQNPELSAQEINTAKRMATELRKAGYGVTENVGGTGVVGIIKNGAGPVLMMRADMDGLPVLEQTNLAYASKVVMKDTKGKEVPVMHACGHDIHMTAMVGAARQLAAMKAQWSGTLLIIMQPAEEAFSGAAKMLADGLFTRFPKPTNAIALHDSSVMPAGTIGYGKGYVLAAVDSVDIDVRGVGGHGAFPHTTKDPVVIAAQIVMALQTLVSRETDPQDAAVVTVGSIHGGLKHNIISDSVKLQLTVRTYDDTTRKRIMSGIKRIAAAQAMSAGVPADKMPLVTQADNPYPATWNTDAQTGRIAELFAARFGKDNVQKSPPVMGGEDFSEYYLANKAMESTIFWLGGLNADIYKKSIAKGDSLPSLHSPFWAPDADPTLRTGVEALTLAALDVLKK
jgi:amidohydrolase